MSIVLNMETKQIENQTPVLNDVKDVSITKSKKGDLVVLISYEHKVHSILVMCYLSKI
jgi:WD repeat-containing protein 26